MTPNALRPPGSTRNNNIYTVPIALLFPFSFLLFLPSRVPERFMNPRLLPPQLFANHQLLHTPAHLQSAALGSVHTPPTLTTSFDCFAHRDFFQTYFFQHSSHRQSASLNSPVQLQLSITTTSAQDVFPEKDCQARRHGISRPKTAQMGRRRCMLHTGTFTSFLSDSSDSKFQIS